MREGGGKLKVFIKAFVLLLFFNILLVYIHYQDASDVSAGNRGQSAYDQEIEVTYRADEIYVRHHFTNLPTHRLEIIWPKESEQRTCYIEDTDSCVRLNEEATAFIEGEETSQSISYVIPKTARTGDTELLQSVFMKLHEASPMATVVHMVDEVNSEGMWMTGLQQIGHQEMELINYTLFSGAGSIEDLYWQGNQQPIAYSSEYLTVYGQETEEDFEQYEGLLAQLKTPHMVLVLAEQNQSVVRNRLVITESAQLAHVFKQLAVNQYYVNYQAETMDPFTAEVITGLLLGNDYGSSLATNAIRQIEKAVTSAQMEQIVENLENKYGEPMSASIADTLIGEVIGYQTSFFQKNSESTQGAYPFLLENPKDLIVSNQDPLKQHAIIKGDRTYYPINEIMEAIGYTVNWNEQSLYIESADNKYRFPLNDYFYVFNERRYNTQSLLVERHEDNFYIEKAAMLRIFRLNYQETSDEINIMPIGQHEEEVQ